MSLLLKSELRLRIGARHCVAEVWPAGFSARCAARASAQDEPQNPVEAALNALAASGVPLPRRAVVHIEDELLYHAMLPAAGGIQRGLQAANEHFSAALTDQELVVGVTLMDAGQRWLASAVPADLLESWRLSLDARDVQLVSAQPAILKDLVALKASVRVRDGLVVLMGAEGLGVVTLRHAAVRDLRWERRDLADLPGLARRLKAWLAECAGDGEPPPQAELLLVPQSEVQASSLRAWAGSNGWRLTAPALATVA